MVVCPSPAAPSVNPGPVLVLPLGLQAALGRRLSAQKVGEDWALFGFLFSPKGLCQCFGVANKTSWTSFYPIPDL